MRAAKISEFFRELDITLAHTQFDAAAAVYVEKHVECCIRNKYILKLASDEGRHLVFIKLIAMLLANDPNDRPTLGSLQTFAVENNVSTRSRVAATLNVAEFCGYLKKVKDNKDGRQRSIVASEKFFKVAEEGFSCYILSILELDPDKYRGITINDREMIAAVSSYGVELCLKGMRPAELIPNMNVFSRRDGGVEIFFRLLLEARHFSSERRSKVNLPFSVIAKELALSRSHVQKFFKAIEDQGFIKLVQPGGKEIEICESGDAIARAMIGGYLTIARIAGDAVIKRRQSVAMQDLHG